MSIETTAKSQRGAFTALGATFAVQTMASMVMFGVAVIVPAAAPDFGLDPNLIGAYTMFAYGAATVAGLLTGAFADRFGAIRVSQVIMLFAMASTAILTLSVPLAAVASAVVLGLCYGPVNPVSTHILARVTPEKSRPLFFSIKQTGMPAGAAIAGILLPIIVAAYDWRVAILVTGLLALLVALLIQPLRSRLDGERQLTRNVKLDDIVAPLKFVWGEPKLRCLTIACFTYSGVQVTVMTFYVVYLTSTLSLSLTAAGLVFTFLQAGAVIGRLFWGAIADRYYPAGRLFSWLGLATAAFIFGVTLYEPAWPLWAIGLTSFVLGTTCAGWNGLFFAELVKYAPQRAGEAASGVQFVNMGGVAAVPPLFGAIVAVTGSYAWPFAAIAVAMIAAALRHRAVFR